MRIVAKGFCHTGTERKNNQDVILMHDKVSNSGILSMELSGNARFFVADGVGGAPSGEVAADFVLNQLKQNLDKTSFPDHKIISNELKTINTKLFEYARMYPKHQGMASTLSGLFVNENEFRLVNAGDSRVLHFRDGKLRQLTKDHTLEICSGHGPITSFFGGLSDSLFPDISKDAEPVIPDDIFLVSTDGIFRSFSMDQLEKILCNSKPLIEKVKFILNKSLMKGAPDNISCIFIKITN